MLPCAAPMGGYSIAQVSSKSFEPDSCQWLVYGRQPRPINGIVGSHQRHELNVGVERQVRHIQHRVGDMANVHARLPASQCHSPV